ncbi:MAG: hypothetical protein LBG92_10115 [Prevotellaceae bacterium]|jgi:hypothetical protein|nr:hypothetical protein [Prevotellaceae bacterium]
MRKIIRILQAALSGDAMKYVVRHRKFLLFLFVIALIYIGNGLVFALEDNKHRKLEKMSQKYKTEYYIKLSKFSKLSRYSNLPKLLKKHGLEELKVTEQPKKLKND